MTCIPSFNEFVDFEILERKFVEDSVKDLIPNTHFARLELDDICDAVFPHHTNLSDTIAEIDAVLCHTHFDEIIPYPEQNDDELDLR